MTEPHDTVQHRTDPSKLPFTCIGLGTGTQGNLRRAVSDA